jgi:hypothetical protein
MLEYPIKVKTYSKDLISVQSAVNLAKTSYVKGCVENGKKFTEKKLLGDCLNMADDHIEKNILFILDQK